MKLIFIGSTISCVQCLRYIRQLHFATLSRKGPNFEGKFEDRAIDL